MGRGVGLHQALEELAELRARYASPGSDAAVEKQHGKRKLTIPERLDLLFDDDTPRFEVGTFAALGQYEEHGDIRSAGVRTVVGTVSGHSCIVIANDSMANVPVTIGFRPYNKSR